jgi:hypothetical protein
MPERGAYHVLDGALFPVGKFHFRLFLAHTWALTADRARFFRALARSLAANGTRLRRWLYALAGVIDTPRARFRFQRFAIPFRIAEMKVRLHEIVMVK